MFHLELECVSHTCAINWCHWVHKKWLYIIKWRFKGWQVLTCIQKANLRKCHCVCKYYSNVKLLLISLTCSPRNKSIMPCCYWPVMPLCSHTLDMFIRYKAIHLQHRGIGLSLPRHSFPNTLAFDALPAPINFDNSAPDNILLLNWLDKSAAISCFWAFWVAIVGLSLRVREEQGELPCITPPGQKSLKCLICFCWQTHTHTQRHTHWLQLCPRWL